MNKSKRALLTITGCCIISFGILYGIDYVVENHPLEWTEYIVGYLFISASMVWVCLRKFIWEDLDDEQPRPQKVGSVKKSKKDGE